ncbi:efflux RND transporter periplasmic adaptor subunit [Sulfurovum sp. zt1-1]|uniref:Efflux RND transporter periplasmic adaptor subunit n=1 Tax=Sulfurovum zhangzhouensis TaxID=3019067 RepID=A0ABT7QW36_9BACT|nr:efflux RND transporter periplasmic adaptor subunit [Sulfurovum zhangzhouensis]MDM5271050.1 efflux RND transporter periplasmic adaptor subunit [Sulfurovum zhangzhouensis]
MTYYVLIVASFIFLLNGCGDKRNDGTVVSGIVEVQEVDLGFEESGIIQSVNVEVGDWVKISQSIAALDSEQLSLDFEALKYEYERTKADLENLNNTPRPEELEVVKAKAEAAQTDYDLAKDEYERSLVLFKQGVRNEQGYLEQLARYQRTEALLKEARASVELVAAGSKKEAIKATQMQMQSMEKKLESMGVRLDKRTLKSPQEGMVLTRNFEAGEFVKAGQTVVTVADLEDCWIKIYLPEKAFVDIHLGEKVSIRWDSKEDYPLEGNVSEISEEASFAPRMNLRKEERSDLYFPVKIKVDNSDHKLKPGMPADVIFSY